MNNRTTQGVCFKCGKSEIDGAVIIKHHIKYNPEIIVDCCRSCHNLIHIKIRKQNKCVLSVDETNKLSTISCQKRYNKKATKRIDFNEKVGYYVQLRETLVYNLNTGVPYWSTRFVGTNNNLLKTKEEQ